MKNWRKTTDPDMEVTISAGLETTARINVSLHPQDIDRLHDVLFDFLKTCKKTNESMTQFAADFAAAPDTQQSQSNPQP